MNDQHPSSLGARAARNLANTTKTPPQMGMITPRWLLRLLPWVDVEAGTFRVNRVRMVGSEFERVQCRIVDGRASVDAGNLRAVPLFRDLDESAAASLTGGFEERRAELGDVLVRQGDDADAFYIVAQGKVEIVVGRAGGGDVVLDVLGPGDYFGEMGLLRGGKRGATARALSPVVLLRLPKERFDGILAARPDLRAALIAVADARASGPRERGVDLVSAEEGEPDITASFVDYDLNPREYALTSIQTILRAHTRVTDLYRSPMDQLKEQLRLVLEGMKERQEWEILNNPGFGLLKSAAPSMRVPTRTGPPTPDDLDELLSHVWKEPAFFLAHPKAIAAFGRECTRRGVPPPTVGLFGSPFLTWRGVPLIPSDKLPIEVAQGVPTTSILLLRVGAERQGVVGLHQPSIGDPKLPSVAIRFNGVDQKGVASYLVSLYFSAALLTDDCLGVLENVELGHFHDKR